MSSVALKSDESWQQWRSCFPALTQKVKGQPLTYLDSAASALKPQVVIERLESFYGQDYSNIHRAVHELAQRSTQAFEHARDTAASFLGAASTKEIVFVRGATEGVNLVAQTYGRSTLRAGDEIVVTALEHHSNIVPWQILCEQTGAVLRVADVDDDGVISEEAVRAVVGERTRIIACAHASNALGTVLPVKAIAKIAHDAGAICLVDGAQAAPHLAVDVAALGCDFYVFSGHKCYGPSGIGVLWGKESLLEKMPPYQGGGDMIRSVSFEGTSYNELPSKFEAGTPHIAGAVGLAAALLFLEEAGFDSIADHENAVLSYAQEQLGQIEGLRVVGTAPNKIGVLSFVMEGAHAHDVATVLNEQGIAVRSGHHCAEPLMKRLNVAATARASLGIYNNYDDVDRLTKGLTKARELFS